MVEIQIGLEIHGYIETKEKLFCTCKNFHDMKVMKPNINICPICSGMPGSKPMLPNKEAINKILQIGLMLNCTPNSKIAFQRKHYNWPDMPSGYQKTISGAYSMPVAEHGEFLGIKIQQVHLEEDPAAWNPETGKIDYNRAGVPLVEIVTDPDFHSIKEIEHWLKQLVLTLSYIKVLNKDAGIKADVNVSIKGKTSRTEIKNVNSTTEIINAAKSEIERHKKEMPQKQETRRWDSQAQETQLMRLKENAEDYRFIPEPDLPLIKINKKRINSIKLPETPQQKLDKLLKKHKLKKEDAKVLYQNLEAVELFEKVIKKIPAKLALPWITTELYGILNYNNTTLNKLDINPEHLIELLQLLQKNKITKNKAKEILRKFIPMSYSPKQEAKKSEKITDENQLKTTIKEILKKNKKSVKDYQSGNKNAINFLIGQIMKATNKRADFKTTKNILEEQLKK